MTYMFILKCALKLVLKNILYMLLLNCALKLVEEIILYYDARSKKHQITGKDIQQTKNYI